MRQSLKKYFEYTKNQQIALLCIIILSVLLQTIYTFVDFSEEAYLTPEEKKWLAKQIVIDSLKKEAKKKNIKYSPLILILLQISKDIN
ncbi:hypothetical protein [Flavobacterium davisii]|uniref:hypothetical protein n=1 Tax=Flavobacterium davisii TaxID=2906077 RepID=UPI002869B607|nr:hypothetical protein [Flavobacterium davisii]